MLFASGDYGSGQQGCTAFDTNVTHVGGTFVVNAVVASEISCCKAASSYALNWSFELDSIPGASLPLPLTECNGTGFVNPPTANVGIKGFAVGTISNTTALSCCQNAGYNGVLGWMWNSSSLDCSLMEVVCPLVFVRPFVWHFVTDILPIRYFVRLCS